MTTTEELLQVSPAELLIGANVRVDTRPDAKDFAASIKARGVLEVITAYRDPDGALVVLRGQRRAVVAARVGTPTGTVPVRVVPAPAESDRIVDQLGENLHRARMREREVRDGVEQLALIGMSAAQIAKRTALPRSTVNTALAVAANAATRDRMDAEDLTLNQAALFVEFEDDAEAVQELAQATRRGHPLEHVAQRLRDAAAEAAEAADLAAAVEQMRAEGLPVLDPDDVPDPYRCRLADLRTADGAPVPEQHWPEVPGAAVVPAQEWDYPDTRLDEGDVAAEVEAEVDGEADETDGSARLVWVPVWICTDLAAAGLHHKWDRSPTADEPAGERDTEQDREVRAAERRRVIANNKAWTSAETVRRKWLAGFVVRKSPPKGAEALICEAVVAGHHSLHKAMQHRHLRLLALLGIGTGPSLGASADRLLERVATPKSATMLTLGCVLAAWEDSTGRHTWRAPTSWDRRVMEALTQWGYRPSDVEALLTTDTAPAETAPADGMPADRDTDADAAKADETSSDCKAAAA